MQYSKRNLPLSTKMTISAACPPVPHKHKDHAQTHKFAKPVMLQLDIPATHFILVHLVAFIINKT